MSKPVLGFTGFVTQRYRQRLAPNRAALPWLFVLLAGILCSTSVRTEPQSAASADTLAPLARLVGRWSGTSEGQPGKGRVERQYERVLASKFIQVRNRSIYPPQEKNPKGETMKTSAFSASTQHESASCSGNSTSKAS